MNITNIPFLSGLTSRLDFLNARTAVLAENIANADTPDYAAKDLKKPDFNALTAESAKMRVSDPRHISVPAQTEAHAYRVQSAPDGGASLTGNSVSLETQAMKISETRQEYALAASLYRKGLAMLRLAARGQ